MTAENIELQKLREEVHLLRREQQIEQALERVRARAMAMQSTAELSEVVRVMYDEVEALKIAHWGSALLIFDQPNNKIQLWFSENTNNLHPRPYDFNNRDHWLVHRWWEFWKSDEEFLNIHLEGQENTEWTDYLFQNTGMKELPQPVKEAIRSDKEVHFVYARMKQGLVSFINLTPFPEEIYPVLKRITRTFDQAYTRFLDVRQAEIQAREAEIQLALERVRASTMAMHESQDLDQVVSTIIAQFDNLAIKTIRCGIGIIQEEKQAVEVWTSVQTEDGLQAKIAGTESLKGHPLLEAIFEHWQKQESLQYTLEGKDLERYYGIGYNQEFKQPDIDEVHYYHCAFFHAGGLYVFKEEAFNEEEVRITKRFADAFQLAYARFEDLKNAELRAREAEIEAALERIRSRTMAMQHSDELAEVSSLLNQQVRDLGTKTWGCAFNIYGENESQEWFGTEVGIMPPYPTPREEFFRVFYEEGQKGKSLYIEEFSGQKCSDHYEFMLTLPVLGEMLDEIKAAGHPFPDYQIDHVAYFKFGYLLFITLEPAPDDHEIFIRFAKVFEQTYTRFLDLQKAEAQAREAQIEAALERVRASSMAMHKSDELNNVLATMFATLTNLDFALARCVIWIYHEEDKSVTWYSANPEGNVESYLIPYTDYKVIKDYWKFWRKRISRKYYDLSGDLKRGMDDYLFYHTEMAKMPKEVIRGMSEPEQIHIYNSFNDFGALFVSSIEPQHDEIYEIIERFSNVFNQAYTRFLDVERAEVQAREAQIEAALERVRAEIASMRTSDDLDRITPLIWKELKILGVPFFRCGVLIMDDAVNKIDAYLSNPDGESLATWRTGYDTLPLFEATVAAWRKQKIYREEWNKEAFISFSQTLIDQKLVENERRYVGGKEAPDHLVLQMVPFQQGMLYVGSVDRLTQDEIELVMALANSFSVAYARYEDFRELEFAKGRVEKTLDELQAAQTQLIHSEKMASLGELTAGIAHEIQNPLNFVNNFSDVNQELIQEVSDAIENKDWSEVQDILNILKDNESKITHHGKRAEDIVKSMLLHSRGSDGKKERTNINALCDEYIRLAYHGFRAKDKSFQAQYELDLDKSIPEIEVIPQDIGRVLLNLINNAFQACTERSAVLSSQSAVPSRQDTRGESNKPKVMVRTKHLPGIPAEIIDKIFQPFFTTKPTGQGTGLGLSLSYDIIKAHGGEINVESSKESGTSFVILLPTANT